MPQHAVPQLHAARSRHEGLCVCSLNQTASCSRWEWRHLGWNVSNHERGKGPVIVRFIAGFRSRVLACRTAMNGEDLVMWCAINATEWATRPRCVAVPGVGTHLLPCVMCTLGTEETLLHKSFQCAFLHEIIDSVSIHSPLVGSPLIRIAQCVCSPLQNGY